MNKSECLQNLTSSCTGCAVMEIISNKWRIEGDGSRKTLENIAERIGRNHCPEGKTVQLPKPSKPRVW